MKLAVPSKVTLGCWLTPRSEYVGWFAAVFCTKGVLLVERSGQLASFPPRAGEAVNVGPLPIASASSQSAMLANPKARGPARAETASLPQPGIVAAPPSPAIR